MTKKFTTLLAVFVFLFIATPASAQDRTPYILLESIPFVSDSDTPADGVQFDEYMKGLFNLLITLVGVAAFLMITVGGFWYVTSAGNQSRATTAKEMIRDALFGLFIAIFAWLLLNTINPNLVTGGLTRLQGVGETGGGVVAVQYCGGREGGRGPARICRDTLAECEAVARNCVEGNEEFPTACMSGECAEGTQRLRNGNQLGRHTVVACVDCVPSDGQSYRAKGPGEGCLAAQCEINSSLNDALNNITSEMPASDWRVNEIWPPTVDHLNSCHFNGTCTDVSLTDPTPENIFAFISASEAQGLRVVYEVDASDTGRITQLRDAGLTVKPVNVSGLLEHFSVYTD